MAGKKSKSKSTRKNAQRKNPVSGSSKAETKFPVGRLNRYLKQGRYAERVGSSAGAFMAAVLEYITAEILEVAGDLCTENKMKTIQPRHVNLGIRSDHELAKLISNTVITEGGQIQFVHESLVPHKKQKQQE